MKFIKIAYTFLFLLFFILYPLPSTLLYASESSAAQFLKLGFGARALGMGESFVAVLDDISSIYYNPAGIGVLEPDKKELIFSHSIHIEDMSISQIGFAKKPFGFSITYFSPGDIEGMSETQQPTSDFTARDIAFSAGYGFKIKEIYAGANFKFVYQKIKDKEANAVCVDAGFLYPLKNLPLKLGGAVSNLGTKIKFENEKYSLPLIYRIGISAEVKEKLPAVFGFEVDFPNDSNAVFRIGSEYKGFNPVFLRLGYKTTSSSDRDAILGTELGEISSGVSDLYGFFMGLGFVFKNIKMDYALLPYGELGNSHRFSIEMQF